MVRENRIKEFSFVEEVTGSPILAGPFYSDHSLNGEIIKVRVHNAQLDVGSLFLYESGVDWENTPADCIWSLKDLASGGLAYSKHIARIEYDQNNAATIFYNTPVINGPIGMVGSLAWTEGGSGIATLGVTVYYR